MATSAASLPPSGTSPEALLRVVGVGLDYPVRDTLVSAVGDVTLTLDAGSRLAVLGPSGCGKSSLLRAIAGFHPPSRGEIWFDGQRGLSPGPDRAVVFQELDQLFPWLTVLGNVAQALRHQGVAKAAARDQAVHQLSALGLGAALDRHPHKLSGCMKQRVAIARALALRPRLRLMDEPFGSLDAITRQRLQQELRALGEETGVAMFFVTHDIDEALVIGQRVIVLTPSPSTIRATLDVPPDPDARRSLAERLRGLLSAEDDSDRDGVLP